MRLWIVVGLIVAFAQVAWGFQDDNSVNTSGHHNEVNVGGTQIEGDIEQRQHQSQAAVAVQGQKQRQSSEQANAQSVLVSESTQGQQRDHVQSSPALYLGAAQEGLSVGTPWGNTSLGKISEVSRITACAATTATYATSTDGRVKRLLDACEKAATRCGLLCRVWRVLN